MKTATLTFSDHYQMELQTLLEEGLSPNLDCIQELGHEAHAAGLKVQEITKIHERTLASGIMPGCPMDKQKDWQNRAGLFFSRLVSQYDEADPASSQVRTITALSRRNGKLAQKNKLLQSTVKQMQSSEKTRIKQEHQSNKTQPQADPHDVQLRNFSRQILLTQEEERKRISRELHDVIAQALVAVNVHLATLKKEAHLNISSLNQNIGTTQRLVARSARIVHQFARELRPAALDDLGLVPALKSFVDQFWRRTGIIVDLQVLGGLETLESHRRTVIFRVVQESLTNVDRHAEASRVVITLSCADELITLKIQDNGRSFRVNSRFHNKSISKRLGLLGMRERVEMVGGTFHIESVPGEGTTVSAVIPMSSSQPQSAN